MERIGQQLTTSFIKVVNMEMNRLARQGHYGQAQRAESARNSLLAFLTSRDNVQVSLGDLNAKLICEYERWLQARGVKKNSTSCYMRTLQGIYNKATANLEDWTEKPFAKVYRGIAKTAKRATTIDVIQQIFNLDIHGGLIALGRDARRKTFAGLLHKLEFARDLFIFSYCARGMAFVDVAYLRKSDLRGGVIRYFRRKTGQHIEVAVEPMMQTIIDRYAKATKDTPYLFPILPEADEETTYHAYRSALRTYNSHLKTLSAMLGDEVCLTSYVARHSWASNMYELNMPLSIISQGLGHDSETTTQIYIKSLENNIIHKANRTLLDRIFSFPFLSHDKDNFNCKGTSFFGYQVKKSKIKVYDNVNFHRF